MCEKTIKNDKDETRSIIMVISKVSTNYVQEL